MPWTIVDGHPDCDDDQVAVVKEDGDGNADMDELEGCHDSESEAEDQIAALEAAEDDRSVVEVLPEALDSKQDVHRVLARVVNRAAEDVDLSPPVAVQNAAASALNAKDEYDEIADCGTGRGEQRAEQIVESRLSPADFVTRENGTPIPAYLKSHRGDVTADGTPTNWGEEEWTDGCGNVQYALWGGTGTGTGLQWSQETANRIAEEMDEDIPYPDARGHALSQDEDADMPNREMSLSDRVSAVRSTFYDRYDDPDGTGAWWYVQEVYEARIIAMADHEGGTLYEITYEIEESPDGIEVEFAPEQEWTVVVQEYVPADEEMERLRAQKRELIGTGTAEDGGCGCGQRADVDELEEGVIVTWGPDNAPRYGAVEEVHTEGEVSSDSGAEEETTMEASEDNPVIEIQHWSYDDEEAEWMETDTVTVHRPDNLQVLEELPERAARSYRRFRERVTDGEGTLNESVLPADNYRSTSTDFRQADDETYTFEINNDEIDRHRTIIEPEGLRVEHFRDDNPVVLWQHGIDPMRGELPIGRVEQLNYNESRNAWIARIRFNEDDFSQRIRQMVDDGYLNMSSIQFDPNGSEMREEDGDRVRVYTDAELLEVSIVSIGSNRGALHERFLRELQGEEAESRNEVLQDLQNEFIQLLEGVREMQTAQVQQMRALATANAAPDEVPAGATAPAGAEDGPASADGARSGTGSEDEPSDGGDADTEIRLPDDPDELMRYLETHPDAMERVADRVEGRIRDTLKKQGRA